MHRQSPFPGYIRRIPVGNSPVDSDLAAPIRLKEHEGVLYPRGNPLVGRANHTDRMHPVHLWALKKAMIIINMGYPSVDQKGE